MPLRLARFLAALAMTFCQAALALGLGEATVNSYLQQPLDARIELITRSEAELASVSARLASAADFRVIGLDRGALSVPLEFQVVHDIYDPHIRVTSGLPVLEPVIQVMIEVTWAGGRMLRQYTLFLDPPTTAAAAPLPAPDRRPPVVAVPSEQEIDTVSTAPRQQTRPEPPVVAVETERPAAPAEAEPVVREAPARPAPDPARVAGTGPDFRPEAEPSSAPDTSATEEAPPASPAAPSTGAEEPDIGPIDDAERAVGPVDEPAVTPAAPEAGAESPATSQVAETDPPDAPAGAPEDAAPEDSDAAVGPSTPLAALEVEGPETEPSVTAEDAEPAAGREPGESESDGVTEPAPPAVDQEMSSAGPTGQASADTSPGETAAPESAAAPADAASAPADQPEPGATGPATPPAAALVDAAQPEGQDAGASAADPRSGTVPEVAQAPATKEADSNGEPAELETRAEAPGSPADPVTGDLPLAQDRQAPPATSVVEANPADADQPPPLRAVLGAAEEALATREVRRGDTLWGIASDLAREGDYGVNQVMLAIQQRNPGAFNRGNINSLKSGVILRLPAAADITRWDRRQAMLEVMRQETIYTRHWDDPAAAAELPTLAGLPPAEEAPDDPPADDAPDALPGDAMEAESAEPAEPAPGAAGQVALSGPAEEVRLELVPPSAGGGAGSGLGEGASEGTGVSSGESVVEELARTQEELVNARQENDYLSQRIDELEAELARREAEAGAGVRDTGLAELEERLREERRNPGPEEPLTVVPPAGERPWLARYGGWLAGLLVVLVAGLVVWLRRRPPIHPEPEDASGAPVVAGGGVAPAAPPGAPAEPVAASPAEATATTRVVDLGRYAGEDRPLPPGFPGSGEEAVELDFDDPETLLDLARAYVSMGDGEAARGMLERVVVAGNDQQAEEARRMLDEL